MEDFESQRHDIRTYEAACIIAELVGDAHTILNVGPSWGRDFYTLTELGKWVVNMDIARQHHLPRTICADATRPFRFPDQCFDAVLLPEVLEHLIEDWKALSEARRVLKESGRLIVTVPFRSDAPRYHVRIHSARTIIRLLKSSGFRIEEMIGRGGWIRLARPIHAGRKFLALFSKEGCYMDSVVKADRWLGKQRWFLKWSTGAYLLAVKASHWNWREENIREFEH